VNVRKYLQDHLPHILFWIAGLLVADLLLWLAPGQRLLSWPTLVYLDILLTVFFFIFMVGVYFYRARWYRGIQQREDAGSDALNWPLTGAQNEAQQYTQDYVNRILQLHREATDQLLQQQEDQLAFITRWVHDIKVPLAGLQLTSDQLAGQVDEETYDDVTTQLERVNHYVEEVLYYSRLSSFANDYLLRDHNLREIVATALRSQMNGFFSKHFQLSVFDEDYQVLTDDKWLLFIINQILANSVQYTPAGGKITITAGQDKTATWLAIADTGVGIDPADLPRIFQKGFTGQNGRQVNAQATGLGLYLAHTMAERLGHELTVTSTPGQGTTVKITFPFLSYYGDDQATVQAPKLKK
jgi:signal transduction histidine kinase